MLIRHAWAGEREAWAGPDRLRPLDERGQRQAEELVELLRAFEVERLLSSPALRCTQTVEPLAQSKAVAIDVRDELYEDRQAADGAALVRAVRDTAVAVSCHGGLSEAVCGVSQKKAEVLVLDGIAVVERLRARGR